MIFGMKYVLKGPKPTTMKCSFKPLLILFCAVISFQSMAQFPLSKTKSKFTAIRGSIGGFVDDYGDLSAEGLLSLIKSNQDYNFDLRDYEELEGYTTISGGNIGFEAIFNPYHTDGTINTRQEIRVGASANIAREAMLDVVHREDQSNTYPTPVTLCIVENEFLVNASYIFRLPYLDNMLDVYAGPSVNIGSTFGNEFIFLGGPEQTLEAKNSSYFRGGAIVGGSVNLRNFYYQMEGSLGLGAQVVHQGNASMLTSSNFRFAIGYRFSRG